MILEGFRRQQGNPYRQRICSFMILVLLFYCLFVWTIFSLFPIIRLVTPEDKTIQNPIPNSSFIESIQIQTSKNDINGVNVPQYTTFKMRLADQTVLKLEKAPDLFAEIDKLYTESPKTATQTFEAIINEEPTKQEKEQSQELIKTFQKRVSAGKDPEAKVLLGLQEALESNNIKTIFSQESTLESKLSLKAISTGFMGDIVKFQDTLTDQEWSYEKVTASEENLQQFKDWYVKKISQQTGVPQESITIHKIQQGSIKVTFSSTDPSQIIKDEYFNKLQVIPFFTQFTISPKDFDPKGHRIFPSSPSIDTRGGWPYIIPTNAERYGIKVSGQYDQGNDDWLLMNNNPGEWAIAFHGVRDPTAQANDRKVFESIMSGRESGSMLRAGMGQAYQNHMSLNKQRGVVGKGIYCSPHLKTALGYTNSRDSKYRLVFQCRVRPSAIKVCTPGESAYWVINDPKDIRPYGIVLVKQSVANSYPIPSKQHPKDHFTYNRYKNEIKCLI